MKMLLIRSQIQIIEVIFLINLNNLCLENKVKVIEVIRNLISKQKICLVKHRLLT